MSKIDHSFDNMTICKKCGKVFEKYRAFHIYCSDECRSAAYKKQIKLKNRKPFVDKQCKQCNKTFNTNNKKKIFCSTDCQRTWLANSYKPVEARKDKCIRCGKDFTTHHQFQKYCSAECYQLAKKERYVKLS